MTKRKGGARAAAELFRAIRGGNKVREGRREGDLVLIAVDYSLFSEFPVGSVCSVWYCLLVVKR